jgi:hypothetical protein
MLNARIKKLLILDRENKLIIFDRQGVADAVDLRRLLVSCGYTLYEYVNVEEFRIIYEERLKLSVEKIAVMVSSDIYVPYDIRRSFREVEFSISALFPNLNADTVTAYARDWDIINFAAEKSYSDFSLAGQTEKFISDEVFAAATIEQYCQAKTDELCAACDSAVSYRDWITIAKDKASIEYYATMASVNVNIAFADEAFGRFIADGYGRLSSEPTSDFPSIVTKTLSVITADRYKKAALIVMDGMSLFDFEAISRHFNGVEYDYGATFAVIPTTTPISRQSLLSGRYPRELSKPFSLADEEKEFRAAAASVGFTGSGADYLRGYDAEPSPMAKLISIIINEVDDIVHGQRQGRAGMLNDMNLLGKSGKLQTLIERLLKLGFAVYITADHGNTPCVGVGGFRSGVEVESRSMRMSVLKDFAEANSLLTENATEYQGYYLDKSYRYYVCKNGVSFDSKGETVMTHGGMSLDEVIVPFIRIRGVK